MPGVFGGYCAVCSASSYLRSTAVQPACVAQWMSSACEKWSVAPGQVWTPRGSGTSVLLEDGYRACGGRQRPAAEDANPGLTNPSTTMFRTPALSTLAPGTRMGGREQSSAAQLANLPRQSKRKPAWRAWSWRIAGDRQRVYLAWSPGGPAVPVRRAGAGAGPPAAGAVAGAGAGADRKVGEDE